MPKASQESQEKPGGNTKIPPSKNQVVNWTWTIPAEAFSVEELYELLSQKAKKFTFSLEQGKEKSADHPEGYLHYQGCMSLFHKEYFATVKNMLGAKAHLEQTKDIMGSIRYCEKLDETHVDGPWNQNLKPLKTITVLRDWQLELRNELVGTEANDRTIVWIHDPVGGCGKSRFTKYMHIKYGALFITSGSAKDIAFQWKGEKIVIFNLSRTKEGFVSYEALEGLKDGMISSPKYESCCKCFDSPHVVVMANFMPELDKLTKDRWDIRHLSKIEVEFSDDEEEMAPKPIKARSGLIVADAPTDQPALDVAYAPVVIKEKID